MMTRERKSRKETKRMREEGKNKKRELRFQRKNEQINRRVILYSVYLKNRFSKNPFTNIISYTLGNWRLF